MMKKNPMKKKTSNRCKTKDCNNIVIEGKYCMYCDRKRKEARAGIMDGAGKAVFMRKEGIRRTSVCLFLTL